MGEKAEEAQANCQEKSLDAKEQSGSTQQEV